jgi:hypothetical protein
MTMAYWGIHYERTQTWWEETRPWHEYLTRCQYLLQKGLFIADLLYLQTEAAPNRFIPPGVDFTDPIPPDPPGYNFDGCTADVVLNRIKIKDGLILLPDGMSYRLMVLPSPGEQVMAGVMTVKLAKKLEELVNEGMIIAGPPPVKTPGLLNYPRSEEELRQIVSRLWGDHSCPGERKVGKGRVVWGKTPREILSSMDIPEDFYCGEPAPFRYIHRRAEDNTDIYFVANKQNAVVEAICSFRVSQKRTEFWWPETGQIEKPAIYSETTNIISLPVRLSEYGSVFVVFRSNSMHEEDHLVKVIRNGSIIPDDFGKYIQVSRKNGKFESLISQHGHYILQFDKSKDLEIEISNLPEPLKIMGPWDVEFSPDWGAPASSVQFPELISWSTHADKGVRYFSGKANYRRKIQIPEDMLKIDRLLFLDLGEVEVMATVKLNGRELGILWKKPFRLDITGAALKGENLLELTVVNLWPNRLIGDAFLPEDCIWSAGKESDTPASQLPQTLKEYPQWLLDGKPSPTGRFTFSIIKVWSKDDALTKSGLIGPVMLHSVARVLS